MKKIIFTILTLVVAGFLVLSGTGCTAKIKEARHLKRAEKYFAAGQYDPAEIEYINVLRNNRLNTEAIGQLGVIYFEEGRFQRAAPFLLKASELETNNTDFHLKVGYIYLAVGKVQEVRDEAKFVLDRNPQDREAPLLLAEASRTQKEMDESRKYLQKLSQNSDQASLEVALGSLSFRGHDFKAAETAFQRAQTLDPKSSAAYEALGTLLWAQNDLKQAETDFKTAADLSPPRSERRLQYAQFETQVNGLDAGKRILDEIVKSAPDYVPAWLGLAEIELAGKKFDDCAASLNRILSRDSDNYDALFLNGRLHLAQGETATAVTELEKIAKAVPQSAQVRYQLALAYLANEQTSMAVNSLNTTVDLDPNFAEAILLLAQLEIKNGNSDSAVASLKQLIQRQSQMTQADLVLADAYRAQGNFDGALEIYRRFEKSFPQDPQIPLLAGATFVQQKNNEQARVEFNRALGISTNTFPALQQLAALDLMEKQYADALQLIRKEIGKNPAQAELQLLMAQVLLAQGDKTQAEAALKKVTELRPEGDTAYLLLGQLYAESKQNDKALTNFKLAVEKNPKSVVSLMALGTFQSNIKNYNAAADTYEKLLAINPKFGPALNNLACLYSDNLNQLDQAYELAQKARGLYPGDPSTADTLGWILCKKGQYESALSLLQESAGKLPDVPEIQFHLGMTYYMMGDEASAKTVFQRALRLKAEFIGKDQCQLCLTLLAIDPKTATAADLAILEKRFAEESNDPVALSRLTSIYERNGNFDKAITAFETALKSNPQNSGATIQLARLYAAKDPQKAFDLAKTAYKLAPGDSEIGYTLGRLAYQNGNYKWAFSLLQEAVQNQPNQPNTLYDFALAAYSLGKISDAAAAMQNALRAGLPSAQSNQATLFLDMISLAANPAQAVAASERVVGILKTNSDYVPALMTFAVINEQKNDVAAAQQSYEKILSLYPDFIPAQRELAILYATDPAKKERAYELAMKARDDFPNDPALTKALGIILFQRGDYSRTVNLLKTIVADRNTDAELFYYLGAAQYHLKNNVESKTSLQRALTLNLSGDQAANAKQILLELK